MVAYDNAPSIVALKTDNDIQFIDFTRVIDINIEL